jgi:adenine phosphoribosyltransferase
LKSRIRTIPDYPRPGIQFRDITTLLLDPSAFRITVDRLIEPFLGMTIDKVAGIEARGFILGGAVARQLECGFIPVRKKGKLPWKTIGQDYALEYGTDAVEIHTDAIVEGERILLVDDLIATGGTAEASIRLIGQAGGEIVGCSFVIELSDLGGRKRIESEAHRVTTLCEFEGE